MKYQPLFDRLRTITHDYSLSIDKKYFNENYGYKKIPAIFKEAFQHIEVKNKWTKEYLVRNITKQEIVEKLTDADSKILMTLEDYLNLNSAEYYFRTSQHTLEKLAHDYKTPSVFNCWYATTKVSPPKNKLSWLYMGVEDTYSDIHRDVWNTSAWNFLIKGKKLWLVYPEMYNSEIKTYKETFPIKAIISDPEILLNQKCKPMICLQEEGDLIYMPGNNYHAVINITETISLTENFINETNYDDVRNYFRRGKNKNNIAAIEAIVREGFEQLTPKM